MYKITAILVPQQLQLHTSMLYGVMAEPCSQAPPQLFVQYATKIWGGAWEWGYHGLCLSFLCFTRTD